MPVSINQHFATSKLKEQQQASDFETYFGVTLTEIPQGPGVTGDYWVEASSAKLDTVMNTPCLNRRIEFKFENMSRRTGNVFCEFKQTSDGGCSYKPSGWVKAIADGCILVVQVFTNYTTPYLMFDTETFGRLLEHIMRQTRTTKGSNGNPVTLHQWGHLIRVANAIVSAKHTFTV